MVTSSHAFRAGMVADVADVKVRNVAAIVIVVILVDALIELGCCLETDGRARQIRTKSDGIARNAHNLEKIFRICSCGKKRTINR